MEAQYVIGVDVGTTFTAAATHRDGRTEIAGLGNVAPPIPSVVFLREDGEILVGEAAARRGLAEPHRLAREFKRRVGDDTPIMLAGSPYSAERLIAAMLREVVALVAAREGGPPRAIGVTHPANWGSFKTDLLHQACQLAGLEGETLVSEPVAAAVHYSSRERVEGGAVVAVYDLGGGTFDAAVLRKAADGFTTLGEPEGIERLGGIDFDAAVFAHVRQALGGVLDDLDVKDPGVRGAMARLRQDCVDAKEALSFDTDATIDVALPNVQTQVRLTRPEFEAMIRPPLLETIEALRRTLGNAGVVPGELAAVLLVGGSSRIPLVAEMVRAELGRPIAVDVHPKHAVALGAAVVAAGMHSTAVAATPPLTRIETPAAEVSPTETTPASAAPAAASPVASEEPRGRPRNKRVAALVGGAIAVAVLALTIVGLAQRGADETSDQAATEETSETSVASPCGSASGRCAAITEVTVEDGTYVARYEVANFDPASTSAEHVHFFFDTTSPENAGSNGSDPGQWAEWDRESGGGDLRFDGFKLSDRQGATQMCIAVADEGHAVEQGSGNCVDLPPDPTPPRRTATTRPRVTTTTTRRHATTSTTTEPHATTSTTTEPHATTTTMPEE